MDRAHDRRAATATTAATARRPRTETDDDGRPHDRDRDRPTRDDADRARRARTAPTIRVVDGQPQGGVQHARVRQGRPRRLQGPLRRGRRDPRARLRPRARTSRPAGRARFRFDGDDRGPLRGRARGRRARRSPSSRSAVVTGARRSPSRGARRRAPAPSLPRRRAGPRPRRPPGPADPALAVRLGRGASCSSSRSSRSPCCGRSRACSTRASGALARASRGARAARRRARRRAVRRRRLRRPGGLADRDGEPRADGRSTCSSGSASRSRRVLFGDVFARVQPVARARPRRGWVAGRVARRALPAAARLPGAARPLAGGDRDPRLRLGRARLRRPRRPEHARLLALAYAAVSSSA